MDPWVQNSKNYWGIVKGAKPPRHCRRHMPVTLARGRAHTWELLLPDTWAMTLGLRKPKLILFSTSSSWGPKPKCCWVLVANYIRAHMRPAAGITVTHLPTTGHKACRRHNQLAISTTTRYWPAAGIKAACCASYTWACGLVCGALQFGAELNTLGPCLRVEVIFESIFTGDLSLLQA